MTDMTIFKSLGDLQSEEELRRARDEFLRRIKEDSKRRVQGYKDYMEGLNFLVNLPCPCCGYEDIQVFKTYEDMRINIVCEECGFYVSRYEDDLVRAVIDWNYAVEFVYERKPHGFKTKVLRSPP
jgi:predicted RNA-binding Zn-ribbon protein involved in translation (DUF1610 family)